MALIVENGTGLADAESYQSVADADTYHSKYGDPAAWSGASESAKEAALRNATQYLDVYYLGSWKGDVKVATQNLAWPRTDVIDEEGREIDEDSLPRKLKDATSYLALRSLSETLMPDQQESSGVTLERKKLGPLETEKRWEGTGGKQGLKEYTLVTRMLAGYVVDFNTGVLS